MKYGWIGFINSNPQAQTHCGASGTWTYQRTTILSNANPNYRPHKLRPHPSTPTPYFVHQKKACTNFSGKGENLHVIT